MGNLRRSGGRVSNRIQRVQTDDGQQSPPKPVEEDNDFLIQGLTPGQMQVLALKVYDLLLDEFRLEAERTGRRNLR